MIQKYLSRPQINIHLFNKICPYTRGRDTDKRPAIFEYSMGNGCYGARRDMYKTESWNGISMEWHGLDIMVVEEKRRGI